MVTVHPEYWAKVLHAAVKRNKDQSGCLSMRALVAIPQPVLQPRHGVRPALAVPATRKPGRRHGPLTWSAVPPSVKDALASSSATRSQLTMLATKALT